jgi:hypothetical protein
VSAYIADPRILSQICIHIPHNDFNIIIGSLLICTIQFIIERVPFVSSCCLVDAWLQIRVILRNLTLCLKQQNRSFIEVKSIIESFNSCVPESTTTNFRNTHKYSYTGVKKGKVVPVLN